MSWLPTRQDSPECIAVSPGESVDIVFRVEGYDRDANTGARVGTLKTITDTKHARVIVRHPAVAQPSAGRVSAESEAKQVLLEMTRAYESKDLSSLMSYFTDDFPNRSELEEFSRRDFRDYDSIKLNIFIKRTVDIPEGTDVETDWELQYFPTAGARQLHVRGTKLHFIFVNQEGKWKVKQMRGANPLFGARSPDVAVSSGAPASLYAVLEKIEDTGSLLSKQAALALVGSEITTDIKNIPVTFQVISVSGHYTDGAQEEVDFTAIIAGRPIRVEASVKIIDNPKNLNFDGVKLEVTDSYSGSVLTITGNVQANQIVTFRVGQTIVFVAGQSGTLTFVLDPDDKFIEIDSAEKTMKVSYVVP
jgi:hypothetical protein